MVGEIPKFSEIQGLETPRKSKLLGGYPQKMKSLGVVKMLQTKIRLRQAVFNLVSIKIYVHVTWPSNRGFFLNYTIIIYIKHTVISYKSINKNNDT